MKYWKYSWHLSVIFCAMWVVFVHRWKLICNISLWISQAHIFGIYEFAFTPRPGEVIVARMAFGRIMRHDGVTGWERNTKTTIAWELSSLRYRIEFFLSPPALSGVVVVDVVRFCGGGIPELPGKHRVPHLYENNGATWDTSTCWPVKYVGGRRKIVKWLSCDEGYIRQGVPWRWLSKISLLYPLRRSISVLIRVASMGFPHCFTDKLEETIKPLIHTSRNQSDKTI